MSAEDEIRALLGTYERSLNDSDADLAAACYASDGVFMPTTLPTVSGDGLPEGDAGIFSNIRLSARGSRKPVPSHRDIDREPCAVPLVAA